MRCRLKIITTIFIIILLSQMLIYSQSSIVSAEEPDEKTASEKVLEQIGVFLANNVYSFLSRSAVSLIANPAYIEIGYNENVSFEIGLMDLKTGQFKNNGLQQIMKSESMTFEILQYPSLNVDKKWRIGFDPPEVSFQEGTERKTTATLSLASPPIDGEPIQSGELIIQINRHKLYSDLWHNDNFFWFIYSIIPTKGADGWKRGWGSLSGKNETGTPSVKVLVKVKPYHDAIIGVSELIKLQPNQIKTIPINITNLGNYKDTFGFNITSKQKGILTSNPIDTTLRPGEKKPTLLAVGGDPTIFDSGTIHEINIEVYSLENPSLILTSRTVLVETRGFYVSEASIAVFIGPIFIIFLFIMFIFMRQKKKQENMLQKPSKPWTILREEKYLKKLKYKDKDQYKQIRNHIKQEYKSVMFWYKNYLQSIKHKETKNITIQKTTQTIKLAIAQLKNKIKKLEKKLKKSIIAKRSTKEKEHHNHKKMQKLQTKKTMENKKSFSSPQKNTTTKEKRATPSRRLKRKHGQLNKKQQLIKKIKKEQRKQKLKAGGV